jgi:hypothetical protein
MSASDLGRVKTVLRCIWPDGSDPEISQATIAAISGLTPTMFMTRVRL